ncbi:MAG: NAD(P)H-binding protein [Solirubrobacterales bacterium]
MAGATGFIGARLATSLAGRGSSVRCLVRDRSKARALEAAGLDLHRGDIDDAESLIYLGGLGDESTSKHLSSRHQTARVLAAEGPPLTYFRAAMVVGAGSESYRALRYLVGRLPVMIAPAWLQTSTQPIGIDAAIEYLRLAPTVPESTGQEVQIGGPDVISYSEMMDRMAIALEKRPRRKLPVPFITPWLSALWLGLVTPVDVKVARPLVEGLTTATVVTDPAGAEPFGISPESFDEALRRALAAEQS